MCLLVLFYKVVLSIWSWLQLKKKKKVYDHDYNRFLLDENMATINTSNFKPLQNLKFHLKRVFFIVIYIFYNFFPTLFNKNMIVLM